MLITLSLLVTLFTLFYYYCVKPVSYWTRKGVKQAKPLWLFGDLYKTVFGIQKFYEWICEVYDTFPNERYFGIYQMVKPILVIKDPELIKQLCIRDFDHFVDHIGFIAEDADPLWSNSLFALRGQKWREMRSLLSPFFTSSKMKNMFILMSESAKKFTSFFLEKDEEMIEVDCKDIFTRFCNDIIATTAFGIETDSLREPDNEFYNMGLEIVDHKSFWKSIRVMIMTLSPSISNFLKIKLFGDHIKSFFYSIINETINIRNEKHIVRPDMIHLLTQSRESNVAQQLEADVMDAGFSAVEEFHKGIKGPHKITNENVASQAMLFFFGGFDSISTLMGFIIYELAVNPDIQNRLRNEIEETMNNCDGDLNYDALMKMKYLDMIVSETLRKYPNLLYLNRECTKPYIIESVRPGEKAVLLDKGDSIWIPCYALHHDEQFFPHPEVFDPERFNDGNKKHINTSAYVPFGLGPRNCIGSRFALMENKVLIFYLLYNFEIVVTAKSPIPLELASTSFQFTSENGFHFGFRRLNV